MPFVLNTRTDAFVKAGDQDPQAVVAAAIERGRAYLDAGVRSWSWPRTSPADCRRHPQAQVSS